MQLHGSAVMSCADGEEFGFGANAAESIYEQLWQAPDQRGAVSAAAKLHHSMICKGAPRQSLSGAESVALRAAMRRVSSAG
jgi:hypothetical protein